MSEPLCKNVELYDVWVDRVFSKDTTDECYMAELQGMLSGMVTHWLKCNKTNVLKALHDNRTIGLNTKAFLSMEGYFNSSSK